MANSGGLPSHPTASNTNPSAFLAAIPDNIILSITPFLRFTAIVFVLESNFPLSNRCILFLGETDIGNGIRLAHVAASINCRIALRRLHGAGYNMTKGDRFGYTPLHHIAMPGSFANEDPECPSTSSEHDPWRLDRYAGPEYPWALSEHHDTSGPDKEREACKTIYAICLNSRTLRAEGRETAEIRLPYSFKIAHPLNLEGGPEFYNPLGIHLGIEKDTALSIAVLTHQGMVAKQLLIEGTYIKLREIQETSACTHWDWFLSELREWDRFPELKHRRKGWYCMKKSTETNDVPPWAHWKKRHAQLKFQ